MFGKFKAVAQGPDADLPREFLDMLYYRHEEDSSAHLQEEQPGEGRECCGGR